MRIIAGRYKGRKLKTTTGPGFRPAMGLVREALFSMLEARGLTWPKARVLDLFAGSGSLGFEALSRGAEQVCFVESALYAARVIVANAELLGIEQHSIVLRREEVAKELVHRPLAPFDVVFSDPPYKKNVLRSTLNALLKNHWVQPGTFINAEVEAQSASLAEHEYPSLDLLTDRVYGQTRVILWQVREMA